MHAMHGMPDVELNSKLFCTTAKLSLCSVNLPAVILEVVYMYVIDKNEHAMLFDIQLCFTAQISCHCHNSQADSWISLFE